VWPYLGIQNDIGDQILPANHMAAVADRTWGV
jgi:hypothetical protein